MTPDDAPTGLAPTDLVEQAEVADNTAWSLDDGEEWEPPRRSWRPVVLALIGSLVLVGIAAFVAVDHLRAESAPVRTPASTVTAAPEPSAPKPTPRATFTAEVPDAVTLEPPPPPNYDRLFIEALKSVGWTVWDEAPTMKEGRMVCERIRNGASPQDAVNELATNTTLTRREAIEFVTAAMKVYPSCP